MFNGLRQYPQSSSGTPVPAPTGGLNDFDPIAAMGDQFMLDCMNIYPDNSDIVTRPGYRVHQSDMGGAVTNVFAYVSKAGEYEVFASTATGVYNIDVEDQPVKVADLTSGAVDSVTFSNVDNSYLIVWNGIDDALLYDGATWQSFREVTTPSAPGEITGINPNQIAFVHVYKARLWFVKKNTMEMFYMPLDAVGGTAEPMPIGGNFNLGGRLVAIGSWSTNTGAGLSARLLAITSEGEVASFSGSDPSDAASWGLDSVFYISPPLGPYSYAKTGGDYVVMTRRGLIPMSSMMSGVPSEVMFANTLTKNISNAIKRLTYNWKGLPFPIQVCNHLEITWLTINVYDEDIDKPVQYVMNITTGAWGRFDYPARIIKTFNGVTYFGESSGRVCTVTHGAYLDNVGPDSPGEAIEFKATSAYNYMGNPTAIKHAKFIRPVLRTNTLPAIQMRVLADFDVEDFDPVITIPGYASDPVWDVAIWDQYRWGGSRKVHLPWISANVLGYAFSWQMKGSTAIEFRMMAAEWVSEGGGLI